MKKAMYFLFPFYLLILIACNNQENSNADWEHSFVVWEGYNYIISSDEIKETEIGEKVDEIQTYLDGEVNVSKNDIFSNKFKKGTLLYSIKGIDKHKSLGVKTESGYVKINSNGKYGEDE
ncbi:hypothetical protein ACQKMD_19935 [Viridibacillus sp. NPDC096237]|uniref:hypothetical protein n=1 Tax=Viridibacillus sp. NPDC096237 TaxID=3390721 RepID=UPI003D04317E